MQLTNYSCLAHCVHLITGIPEAECMRLCETSLDGTSMDDALDALKKLGYKCCMADLFTEEKWPVTHWKHLAIISVCDIGSHAILLRDGEIIDPNGRRYPQESFPDLYKNGHIEEVIFIEKGVDK